MQQQKDNARAPSNGAEWAALEALVIDNPDLERLEALLDQFNIFEAVGAVRQEVRHSDFLAFLLSPQQPHGLGDTFLRRFLQKALHNIEPSDAPVTPIDLDIWSLDETLVLREWRDIDILVLDEVHRLAVLIENKIDSHEHSDQLQRYYAIVQAHYPSWRIAALYLTPDGEAPSDPRYLAVDYVLISMVLEQLIESRASTLGADVLTAITHYVRMLRRHIVGDSEIAELCRRIYLKHQRALDLIYEYRPDRQTEIREVLDQLIQESSLLVSDSSSKTYVRFAPRQWDEWSVLLEGSGWTRSGRMLLFEFSYRGNDLRLKLYVGPGPNTTRQQLLNLALANRPPFTVTDKTLYQKWNTLYDHQMVRGALSPDASIDEIAERLRQRWSEFLEDDLQSIMTVLQDQQEVWQQAVTAYPTRPQVSHLDIPNV